VFWYVINLTNTNICHLIYSGSNDQNLKIRFATQVIVRNFYHSKRTGKPGLQGSQKGSLTADELDQRIAAAIRERASEAKQEKGK
jgi:hypothetical protein